MKKYFIESFRIDKLWGYLDMNLIFEPDVNILIGPNGSGKTTVLNLLNSILLADFESVVDVEFDQAVIKLREFEGRSVRTVKVEVIDRLLKLSVGQTRFEIDIDIISDRRYPGYYRHPETGKIVRRTLPRHFAGERMLQEKLDDILTPLVPIVWLPVSRRLPVTEDEEERYTRTNPVESVDARLQELLKELARYHTRLNAQLSERYRKFEHQVLSEMLYSKKHDQVRSIRPSMVDSLLTEDDKKQLVEAFEAAGFLDEDMQSRIDAHFAAAEHAAKNVSGKHSINLEEMLVVPLIRRTKAMVEYAGELEKDREDIFKPLRNYERTVNSFLNDKKTADSFLDEKSVKVDEDGELKIESSVHQNLDPLVLSSGEKQILILLTEALLRVNDPVVYIADEPELSLHISWQEKLLRSLVELGGQMQVIVATHSPDIIGRFMENTIDLGRDS